MNSPHAVADLLRRRAAGERDERVLPMRFERVLEHRVRFHPLATDVETGRAVDLAPAVRDRASLKLALRATTALPLLAGPPVVIEGRRYLDAGLAESIPFHAALAAGATHVLVLRSRRPQDEERPGGAAGLRLESDSGVVRAGLETGREAALAVLRPLAAA